MRIARERNLPERAAIELAAVDAMMRRSLQRRGAPKASIERRVFAKVRPR
jgi:hypothetical protein